MNVALFIPCYVDQFYPQVGIATMRLLEKAGVQVSFPMQQTCCGQPMANAGCEADSIPVYHNYVRAFADYDYIVAPSGSLCVSRPQAFLTSLSRLPPLSTSANVLTSLFSF